MPPKPFPFPVSIGIDICHIPRIREIITKDENKRLDRFTRRIFNTSERPDAQKLIDRYHRTRRREEQSVEAHRNTTLLRLAEWLAGRFAAKEAAMKAISSRRLTWHDICVHSTGKAPYLTILDPPRRNPNCSAHEGGEKSASWPSTVKAVHEKGLTMSTSAAGMEEGVPNSRIARVSISHDGEYATAVVMAFDDATTSHENQRQ
ncbi:MAG: hypothetical protein M1837_005220 [Sclerophora amabilis]|nr:MAG: hypothetical protein M1837_005220 [Sclerophora amabilis]